MTQPKAVQPDRNRQFILIAVLFLAIFVLLGVFYRVPALYEARLYREALVWPVTLGLMALYWQGFRALDGLSSKTLWLLATLVALAAVAVPHFHSTDLFGYINRGWQQAHYGLNPYVHPVDDIPGWERDPMITDHWVNNPSPYGFLYLQIARLLCLLGGGQLATTVAVFKAFNLLAHAATALLVWLGVKRLDGKPETALYLYAFNPLVLVHALANGHNDIIMGFFVTLGAYCAIAGVWIWIIPALVAATLVKYGALVILPTAVLFLIKARAWRALGLGLFLGALVFFISGIPYLPDWQSFHLKEISRNAFVSHGSFHSLIYSLFKTFAKEVVPVWHANKEIFRDILKNILLLAYAGFYGWLGLQRLRQREYSVTQWIQDALLVMVVMVCLVSLKFYPWYFGMFFPLALYLSEGHWLRRLMIVMSCAQLFSITFIGQAHVLNFIVMTALPIAWIVREHKQQRADAEP